MRKGKRLKDFSGDFEIAKGADRSGTRKGGSITEY